MHMAGFPVVMHPALDGNGVVILGYKSSRLSKVDMTLLIDAIDAYGAMHGVAFVKPEENHHE